MTSWLATVYFNALEKAVPQSGLRTEHLARLQALADQTTAPELQQIQVALLTGGRNGALRAAEQLATRKHFQAAVSQKLEAKR